MANKDFTDLPSVTSAFLGDIYAAVQGGVTSQVTATQIFSLMLQKIILTNAGNPNGFVAGQIYQLCWDSSDKELFICTFTGSATTAIWTQASIGINDLVTAVNGGTGVASPTIHTLPVAQGSSPFHFVGPLTNGQLLIGSTGADPVPATILPGSNINVTNGAGTITISATGTGAAVWNVITAANATMTVNQGYITNRVSLVNLLLPATSGVGDEIQVIGQGAGGWIITQAAGQQIILGTTSSTLGAGGSISSTNQYDSVTLICTVANTIWTRTSIGGNLAFV